MSLWNTLKDASGRMAEEHARKTDRLLDQVEKRAGNRLNQEQQQKIAQARNGADQMREFAERRRHEQELRERYK